MNTENKKPIIIIDSLNILYRSFYSLKDLKNSSGIYTGAIFGLCNTILKLIKNFEPKKIFAAGDTRSKIRKNIFENYKANRAAVPEELISQKILMEEFFELISIPFLKVNDYEADDIIYSLCISEEFKDENIIVITSDKDLHYLTLNKNVTIFDPAKDKIIDFQSLKNIYGNNVTKESIWAYYSLMGDSSDNIPGVPGIGEKTALKIINNQVSLDSIYNSLNSLEISNKIKDILANNKEIAYLSLSLIKPIFVDIKNFLEKINKYSDWNNSNFINAINFFEKLELKSILKKITDIDIDSKENKKSINILEKELIDHVNKKFIAKTYSHQNKDELFNEIKKSDIIAVDVETRGGNPRKTLLVGFSLCMNSSIAWYIPLIINNEKVIDYEERLDIFKKIKNLKWILHNALSDLHTITNNNGVCSENLIDTYVIANMASIFMEKNKIFKFGLKELSLVLLKEQMTTFYEVIEGSKYKYFDEVPLESATNYASADARQTFCLYKFFEANISKDDTIFWKLLTEIEMPLINVLFKIEKNGINCDSKILKNQEILISNRMKKIWIEIQEFVDLTNFKDSTDSQKKKDHFNPLSPAQTAYLLYDILKLKKTKTKKSRSTNHGILLQLINHHPLIPLIIEYRELNTIVSRFTKNIINSICSDGRIRTHFQQINVETGRLSTIDPNLQNIPRDKESISIRSAFNANDGNSIISLDYSQIELRVLAHITKDKNLLNTFNNNDDVHLKTAEGLFLKNKELISENERQIAKKINFSIIYGLSAYGLSKDLNIKLSQAAEYIDSYKKLYPDLFLWIEKIYKEAIENGFVTTLFGRTRIIPELKEKNKALLLHGCRAAVNTIIQGTAAEIMKKSMIKINDYLKQTSSLIVLQIHDEILIESPSNNAEEISNQCINIMENIFKLDIPLKVNKKIKSHW